jgi:hypothetical protein
MLEEVFGSRINYTIYHQYIDIYYIYMMIKKNIIMNYII